MFAPDLPPLEAQPSEQTTKLKPPNLVAERLGMTIDKRFIVANLGAFFCGFTLGASHAGRMASLRFRAENAHRLPISQPGWYLYHKSKHYNRAKVGITEGVKKGFWLMGWVSIFFLVEESLDIFRGTWTAGRTLSEMEGVDELEIDHLTRSVEKSRNFVSSTLAGMATAGLWGAWNHFPLQTAARTIRTGLVVGLGYGLAQDGMKYLRATYIGEEDPEEHWTKVGSKNWKLRHGVTDEVGEAERVVGR